MNSVSIYTVHYNKLEFLTLQYNQLLKHCLDNFDYVVVNNGIDEETKSSISEFCQKHNIREIHIDQETRINYCSHDHIMALDYAYVNYIAKDTSLIRVVMDSDVIPFTDFSFKTIIGSHQIAGFKVFNYSSAIFTMYNNEVQLKDFNINGGGGDSGSGTGILANIYDIKWINITAPIREEEHQYIFKYHNVDVLKYDQSYGFQFIEKCFIHFYRGTGWDNGDYNYFNNKFNFLNYFLNYQNLIEIRLDDIVQYPDAFMDQWMYKDKYKLYLKLNS